MVLQLSRWQDTMNWLRLTSLLKTFAHRSVTLGDEEARRRGGRKTVQERASPPTFDVAIELLERRKWCVYSDVAAAVDSLLLGTPVHPWLPYLS